MDIKIQRKVARERNIEDEDGVTGQRVSKERSKNQEPIAGNIETTESEGDKTIVAGSITIQEDQKRGVRHSNEVTKEN